MESYQLMIEKLSNASAVGKCIKFDGGIYSFRLDRYHRHERCQHSDTSRSLKETPTAGVADCYIGFVIEMVTVEGGHDIIYIFEVCVDRRSLIFRISIPNTAPDSLKCFFASLHNVFVSKDVNHKMERLSHYGQLGAAAVMKELSIKMLVEMVNEVFVKSLEMSVLDPGKWNSSSRLIHVNVHYACMKDYFYWTLAPEYTRPPQRELDIDPNVDHVDLEEFAAGDDSENDVAVAHDCGENMDEDDN